MERVNSRWTFSSTKHDAFVCWRHSFNVSRASKTKQQLGLLLYALLRPPHKQALSVASHRYVCLSVCLSACPFFRRPSVCIFRACRCPYLIKDSCRSSNWIHSYKSSHDIVNGLPGVTKLLHKVRYNSIQSCIIVCGAIEVI